MINFFSKTVLMAMALMVIFSQIVLAQGQAQKNIERQRKEVIDALNLGDCNKAQKQYNILKTLSGKKFQDLEKRISDCKGIPVGYVDLGLPSGTLWRKTYVYGFYTHEEAAIKFGKKLPTKEQWEELRKYCNWRWVNGYYIAGPSGDSIYIFAAGYQDCSNRKYANFREGCYWTSTTSVGKNREAWAAEFNSEKFNLFESDKCNGCSVMLVSHRNNIYSKTQALLKLSPKDLHFDCEGGTTTISISANDNWKIDIQPASWVKVIQNESSINIHVLPNNYPEERTDFFTVVMGYNEEIVSITQKAAKPKPIIRSGYVDLGLPSGTKWKATNENKQNYFTYDEAVREFGNRLPTKAQLEELKDKCRWKWDDNNKEFVATGPNGFSICFPSTSFRNCSGEESLLSAFNSMYLWSSTSDGRYEAWNFSIYYLSDFISNISSSARCAKMPVRLVQN